MGITAILLNGAELFEQIAVNTPLSNLMKISQAISEKKTKDYTILNMYKALGPGQITPRGQTFDCN